MYIVEDFIDMGLANSSKENWPTNAHRKVAIHLCLRNPNVFTMERLVRNIEIINAVPITRIEVITAGELQAKGVIF